MKYENFIMIHIKSTISHNIKTKRKNMSLNSMKNIKIRYLVVVDTKIKSKVRILISEQVYI